MDQNNLISRRALVQSSFFGLIGASIPSILFAKEIKLAPGSVKEPELFHRYPSIDDAIVAEVVGVSHFNLDRLKELVNRRQDLAKATWDWGFGDWESAIGAASHVGRRDIVEYLLSKGAPPDIFTYAMLGAFSSVQAMINATPGIQSTFGPHGISLLQHAKNGLNSDTVLQSGKDDHEKLITYLESLGNADPKQTHLEMTEAEMEKYLGDYKYGDGPNEGFSVKLNSRKFLSLGKIGKFGGSLYRKGDYLFSYNGISSLEIFFTVENGKAISLEIREPDLTLLAKKI
jgi:hypothetical protein